MPLDYLLGSFRDAVRGQVPKGAWTPKIEEKIDYNHSFLKNLGKRRLFYSKSYIFGRKSQFLRNFLLKFQFWLIFGCVVVVNSEFSRKARILDQNPVFSLKYHYLSKILGSLQPRNRKIVAQNCNKIPFSGLTTTVNKGKPQRHI